MRLPLTTTLPALLAMISFSTFCSKQSEFQPGGNPPAVAAAPQVYPEPTRPPAKWALLVGIDKYRHSDRISSLSGCVNDVMDMKALLLGKYEFPEQNVLVLTNEQATHAGIVAALQNHLIAHAERDDIVVFHFSGHGSQMKDISGDEPDGWDETLVPHDSRDPQGRVFDLSDDELNGLLQRLSQKTKNVTFIFDSCHSGTATRGALTRNIPPDDRQPPASVPAYAVSTRGAEAEGSDLRLQTLNYVLIAGCLSKQTSFEHLAEGKERGALTYFLVRELRHSRPGATYRDVMDRVKGNVNALYPNQLPQLEGTKLDQYVFSDSTGLAQPYVLASPAGSNQVKLAAGDVQSVTAGSIFEIYQPGAKKFAAPEQPLAKAEVTSVSPFSAAAKIISGRQIPAFARAVERERRYPDQKLRVYYQGLAQSPALQAIKTELDGLSFVETSPAPRSYHLLLRQIGDAIATEGADTTEISPRVPVRESGATARVVHQVKQWAKWFNVLSLDNPAATVKIDLAIRAVQEGITRDPFAAIDKAEAVLAAGESFEVTVTNQASRDLYLSILDLSTDGSIAVIYPYPEGASELLKAGASVTQRFDTFVPENRATITDVIKVFATASPVDFHVLTQAAVRDVQELPADPLGQLLAQATLGQSRGAKPSAVDLGSWATSQRVFKIKR